MADRNRKYNLLNTKDVEELQKLMFEDTDEELEEDFEDEVDTDGEDEIETRQESSETEEDDNEDVDNIEEDAEYFVGKDKETRWSKNPPSQRVRSRSHNLIRKLPGVVGAAKSARTPLECWSCLFSDDILNIIVQYTNQYIESIKPSFQRERDARPIDVIELRAFIGLLILAGVHRSNRQCLEDLWGSDGDGIEKFRLVMNLKRFKFIVRCLRFDDRVTREERRQTDKIAAVRQIFEKFVGNCQKYYSLGENVTIDEKLEGFRGRCNFRQYIPSKPNKYGIKIYALVDSQVFYLYNLEIYAGLQPEGMYRISNKPTDVVLRLCQPIYGSGRNVTADNWFTSIELVEELRSRSLSYVGTIKKNKRQIPTEFIIGAGRAVNSSLFGFRKNLTMASYIPKKGKCVILVSSLHEDKSIDPDTRDKQKPSIITYYNSTKGGVDTTDKLCASYNVARNVRRWPMVIFFAMINMSGINAQVIYFGNDEDVVRRKVFLKKLSHELVLPQISRRSASTSGIHRSLQDNLKRFRPQEEEENQDDNVVGSKRKRCQTCTMKRRLTKYNCENCKKPICLIHIKSFCSDCARGLPSSSQHNTGEESDN